MGAGYRSGPADVIGHMINVFLSGDEGGVKGTLKNGGCWVRKYKHDKPGHLTR